MLHFGPEYTFKENALVLNIPTKNYEAKVIVDNIKAEFDIIYSWSGKNYFDWKFAKSWVIMEQKKASRL